MIYVALAMAAIGLIGVWRCQRAIKDLKERNHQLNSRIYHLKSELQDSAEQYQQSLMRLRYDLMRQAGELRVTGETTIAEIEMLHPQSTAVLAGFHIGGCAGCAVDGSQRLAEAVAANDRELEPILVALNALVTENEHDPHVTGQFKSPNVELAF
jgi:hypothetical protein